ncbi:TraX family protein [Enterococcus sp. LJL128]
MDRQLEKQNRGFTIFDLKILGIILMFIDHIHEMFALMGAPDWIDWFGRPVATLFFFVSAEGFSHTRNKQKYLQRLLIGFWVMGAGNFVIQRLFPLGDMGLVNNIFADLFVAVLAMYGTDLIKEGYFKKNIHKFALGLLCMLLPILLSGIALLLMSNPATIVPGISIGLVFPTLIFTENFIMVYLATLLYLLRNKRVLQCVAIAAVSLLFAASNLQELFTANTQWMMIFSIIPIALYNGERGKGMKQFFYVFYPAHIWLLYLFAVFIFNHFYS